MEDEDGILDLGCHDACSIIQVDIPVPEKYMVKAIYFNGTSFIYDSDNTSMLLQIDLSKFSEDACYKIIILDENGNSIDLVYDGITYNCLQIKTSYSVKVNTTNCNIKIHPLQQTLYDCYSVDLDVVRVDNILSFTNPIQNILLNGNTYPVNNITLVDDLLAYLLSFTEIIGVSNTLNSNKTTTIQLSTISGNITSLDVEIDTIGISSFNLFSSNSTFPCIIE